MRKCEACGDEITRRMHGNDRGRFCNRSCAGLARRSTTSPWRICPLCGSAKSKASKTSSCGTCRRNSDAEYIKNLVIADLRKTHDTLSFHAKIRGYSRTVYRGPLECLICGYNKHVNVCHIRPIKGFPSTASMGEVNAICNLVALCPNHHWEFDHGLVFLPGEPVP